MADNFCKHEGDAVLLVEGKDDCHVVLALCAVNSLAETFGIYECGSDALAIKRLNALIASSKPPHTIGLVIDADDPNLSGRWTAVRAKLAHYGYQFPTIPAADGTILEPIPGAPRLGFWLMPNNEDTGMLEDFCCDMIDQDRLAVTKECVDLGVAKGAATFKAAHYTKAVVHTFLAMQDEPGRPLGQAITAESLRSAASPTARTFVSWLGRLFGSS
jgi:hypothetical protein